MLKMDINSRYTAEDELELATGGPGITRNLAMTKHQLFLMQRVLRVALGEHDLRFSATELVHLKGLRDAFWDTAVDSKPDADTATHCLCL